jgi:hypothetical protein
MCPACNSQQLSSSGSRVGSVKTRRLFCPTSQARRAKIFLFPKDGSYDLKNPARLDMGDVMAIRHQT